MIGIVVYNNHLTLLKYIWDLGAVMEVMIVLDAAMINNHKMAVMAIFNVIGPKILDIANMFQWACAKGHLDIVVLLTSGTLEHMIQPSMLCGGYILAVKNHHIDVVTYLVEKKIAWVDTPMAEYGQFALLHEMTASMAPKPTHISESCSTTLPLISPLPQPGEYDQFLDQHLPLHHHHLNLIRQIPF